MVITEFTGSIIFPIFLGSRHNLFCSMIKYFIEFSWDFVGFIPSISFQFRYSIDYDLDWANFSPIKTSKFYYVFNFTMIKYYFQFCCDFAKFITSILTLFVPIPIFLRFQFQHNSFQFRYSFHYDSSRSVQFSAD